MLGRTTAPPPSAPSAQSGQTAPQTAASPARRFTDAAVGATTLRARLQIRGSITGTDSVYIAGQVEGPIEVEGLLHLTETARVTGPITAVGAVIEGEFSGRIFAKGRVELCATARVRAEIHAVTVAIAEGCFFEGRVHMGGGAAAERGPTHFREKRRRRGHRPGAAEPGVSQATPPVAAAPAASPTPAAVAPAAPSAPAASVPPEGAGAVPAGAAAADPPATPAAPEPPQPGDASTGQPPAPTPTV